MSDVVVDLPCRWKAWLLHCLSFGGDGRLRRLDWPRVCDGEALESVGAWAGAAVLEGGAAEGLAEEMPENI
ncbi:hypothetical protein EYF80_026177 [Liparis tanakae]|uniref:Uncharacterized protein n=1 Tax=Liparis tanakae TaxID=230148 RepID=A0A4Z2HDC7_9TELE|nr:hypothetical protein EYF80_026177 [Liparis tanakae]